MRREKFRREREVLLAPHLAMEAIYVARGCKEREKTGERGERGECGREKREGHCERRRRMRATRTSISFFLIYFLFF